MTERKTAVVTGSSSGIGLGIARALAETGMNVVMNGIEPEAEIESERAAIAAQFGVEVVYDRANLMQPEGARELIDGAIRRFGGVDVLVNNAGIQFVAPVDEFP
ncbi:MAG: SDR family NAD(P)-dependent oxidoreductase, partial [Wenzhouxiangellaceae bacterium]|nr:SDR family NAD(P)-dependent oxidoreductase [Wenzhouxiangellaceae bacterium]